MKAWKSGVWSISGQAIQLAVTLVSLAVLGRLLTPEDFGTFGLILALQALLLPALDMGLQFAYIKLDEPSKDASNAFYTINALTGTIISIAIALLAPWIANFYQSAALEPMLLVFAFSILFTSLSGQPLAYLSREKRFDKIVLANTIVMLTGSGLAIALAWNGFGAWSLIWKAIYESLARLILYVLMSGERYSLVKIDTIKLYVREIGFGLEIVFSRFFSGWVNGIDKLIIGKFLPLGDLGGFMRAQQIALMPDSNIRSSITTPALSYLARKNDDNKLKSYLLLFLIVFLMAGSPCLILMVYGDNLFTLFLGQQWNNMGWMLQWMGLLGLARVFQGMTIIYHIDRKVVARTNWYTLGSVVCTLFLPITMLFLTKSFYSFVLGLSIASLLYWFFVLLHTLVSDWSEDIPEIVRVFVKYFVVGLFSTAVFLYFKEIAPVSEGIDSIVIGIGLQLLVIVLSAAILFRREVKILFDLI